MQNEKQPVSPAENTCPTCQCKNELICSNGWHKANKCGKEVTPPAALVVEEKDIYDELVNTFKSWNTGIGFIKEGFIKSLKSKGINIVNITTPVEPTEAKEGETVDIKELLNSVLKYLHSNITASIEYEDFHDFSKGIKGAEVDYFPETAEELLLEMNLPDYIGQSQHTAKALAEKDREIDNLKLGSYAYSSGYNQATEDIQDALAESQARVKELEAGLNKINYEADPNSEIFCLPVIHKIATDLLQTKG
jgi:hypothetical protein